MISVSIHNKHQHHQPKSLPWTWAISIGGLHHREGMARDEAAARVAARDALLELRADVERAISDCTGQLGLFGGAA